MYLKTCSNAPSHSQSAQFWVRLQQRNICHCKGQESPHHGKAKHVRSDSFSTMPKTPTEFKDSPTPLTRNSCSTHHPRTHHHSNQKHYYCYNNNNNKEPSSVTTYLIPYAILLLARFSSSQSQPSNRTPLLSNPSDLKIPRTHAP